MTEFSENIIEWFNKHGRHDLPWQRNPTPYRVWVSEIMLQQTQVATAVPYFQKFMDQFPTVSTLATADLDQVLHLWSGLGYYARARNLHKTAKSIEDEHQGNFPRSIKRLEEFSGVGRSTAGAIAALSMDMHAVILDGNVKRVLTRFHAIEGWTGKTEIQNKLWRIAERHTPKKNIAAYTQAIMDLGATVCTRSNPSCGKCPLSENCSALNTNSIDKFPEKKRKKKLPIKSVVMFIFQNESGEVYLEKRPPRGVWGSLYSFPENCKEITKASDYSSKHFLLSGYTTLLEPLRHTFSHYHLDIQPQIIAVAKNSYQLAESGGWLWYPLDHSIQVGLAAPVKKLLTVLALNMHKEEKL